MKKSFLFLLAVVILASCNKTADEEVLTLKSQEVNQKEPEWPKHLNRVYRLDWPNQGDEWCGKPRLDCWDDLIIYTRKSNVYSIYQEFVTSYNSGALVSFFSNENYAELFPYMTSEIQDHILKGAYSVQLRQNSQERNTQIVVVQDQRETVVAAYPLNIQE
jgi:hypothetical protein